MDWMRKLGWFCLFTRSRNCPSRLSVLAPTRGFLGFFCQKTGSTLVTMISPLSSWDVFKNLLLLLLLLHLNLSHESASRGCCQSESSSFHHSPLCWMLLMLLLFSVGWFAGPKFSQLVAKGKYSSLYSCSLCAHSLLAYIFALRLHCYSCKPKCH